MAQGFGTRQSAGAASGAPTKKRQRHRKLQRQLQIPHPPRRIWDDLATLHRLILRLVMLDSISGLCKNLRALAVL
jgi:hypothetical protein